MKWCEYNVSFHEIEKKGEEEKVCCTHAFTLIFTIYFQWIFGIAKYTCAPCSNRYSVVELKYVCINTFLEISFKWRRDTGLNGFLFGCVRTPHIYDGASYLPYLRFYTFSPPPASSLLSFSLTCSSYTLLFVFFLFLWHFVQLLIPPSTRPLNNYSQGTQYTGG